MGYSSSCITSGAGALEDALEHALVQPEAQRDCFLPNCLVLQIVRALGVTWRVALVLSWGQCWQRVSFCFLQGGQASSLHAGTATKQAEALSPPALLSAEPGARSLSAVVAVSLPREREATELRQATCAPGPRLRRAVHEVEIVGLDHLGLHLPRC